MLRLALLLPLLCVASTTARPDATVPVPTVAAPCRNVGDCWLDDRGNAIARPKRLRGRKLPKGDCGRNLLWLRNELSCAEGRCVALPVGDRC